MLKLKFSLLNHVFVIIIIIIIIMSFEVSDVVHVP
jgi:hypothetical protein